jgi:hypothetical protein
MIMKRFLDGLVRQPFNNSDDGSGAGGGNGDEKGAGDKGDEGDDGADKRTVTMTQAELDTLIKREKGRVAKKYADYDEKAQRLAELEQAEEDRKKAAMTEKERLEAEKAEAARTSAEALESAKKVQEAANQRVIKAEFRTLARELGVRADALDDALKLADLSGITVDDDGNAVGVKDVVDALVKAKPYLAEPPKKEPKQIGEGSNHKDDGQKTKDQMLADAADLARKTGRIEDRAAYASLKAKFSE